MRLYCYLYRIIFLFIVASVLPAARCYSQSYGLEFASHEVVQDKRTSLDLSPDKSFTFNSDFTLSFDVAFVPNMLTYFGYVVRIIEGDNKNIDLLYDNSFNIKNHFNVIVGDKLSDIKFDIDRKKLFNQWVRMDLVFDYKNDRLELKADGKQYLAKNLHLKKGSTYKIIFGVNNYKQFETTDVPPIRLKDVKLYQKGLLFGSWPLNEQAGNIAHNLSSENQAEVNNPVWILSNHYNWKLVQTLNVDGIANPAFDSKKGILYITAADSLYRYDISTGRWDVKHYKSGHVNMNIGEQSIFNPHNSAVYNIFPDQRFVSKYDSVKQQWDKKLAPGLITNFTHFNKVFSQKDTSVYLFGGYGQLNYKNEVIQYHLNTGKWENLKVHGDFFTPRYLAGLGSNLPGDTIYVMGGYGSESGRQILNPRNIYDVLRFTVKDKTFKKIGELKTGSEDFAFANSVVVDDKRNTYYGLIFPQHKYNSTLQLIEGALNNSSYKIVGSGIPYEFHDIHSYADLYYSPSIKKFVAVTILRSDNGKTKINIYTLLGPPANSPVKSPVKPPRDFQLPVIISILGIIICAGVFIYLRKRKNLKTKPLFNPVAVNNGSIAPQTISEHEAKPAYTLVPDDKNQYKNAIFLFGELQVFDSGGIDITRNFTPRIKELFLIIILHSIKYGRGLSSEKLNEILWYDKSEKDARNNRSVNLTRLKSLLDRMGGYCHLSKDTGYWMIDIDYSQIYVDYHTYIQTIRDKKQLNIEKVTQLTEIVKRGSFLTNIEYEWLDSFKSEISNDVIDNLLHFLHDNPANDPELVIEIVNFIFCFDPVNEEAMMIKCKTLSGLGKHSLAHYAFENFIKEYRNLYGEEFKKDFHTVTE